MSINWFPGHMAKTLKDVQSIKGVDLIIEVVDARAIHTSNNPELTVNSKLPKLIIALKGDLSDLSSHNYDHNILVGSIRDKSFYKKIIQAIDSKLASQMKRYKSKGLLTPQFNIMVVGLPNVGKSSLINFLANKKVLIVENRPGVTKNRQLIKITNNYFVYDTPGVFVKKINRDEDGFILALIGTIKKEVLPLNEVVQWAFNFYSQHYYYALSTKYKIMQSMSCSEFLNHICALQHFYLQNNVSDIQRAINYLYSEFINGHICKVNYEK